MKYGFAGDREISVKILKLLIDKGHRPCFLLVGDTISTSHKEELIKISELDNKNIFTNKDIKNPYFIRNISNFNVDYIFGIHYPFIIKKELLDLPKIGFLNLHPAYLPYNKGWHTPSWAIYEDSEYGASLHFMSENLDEGDIILQKKIEITQEDTANSLYKKVLNLEYEVFKDALPSLLTLTPQRKRQETKGTTHNKKDLESIREIDITKKIYPIKLINKLRALTTNNIEEAAYFKKGNFRYKIQIKIEKDEI